MRLPFSQRRSRRPPASTFNSALLTLAALAPSFSEAIHFNPAPPANLDFSNLGRIAIAGDFNGISLYEYEGQISKPLPTNGSESLLTRLPNGALAPVVATDASIRAMCLLKNADGNLKGVVIGGNFTSIDGTQSTAIALFNPNSTEVTPIKGLEGEVNALYCDDSRKTVYVGGTFKGSNSTNAIAWSDANGWINLPFAGFNGPVNAISKTSNGHIVFGGSFTGLGNASAPSQPDSQIINLSGGTITATNGATTNGFSDPKNIVCSAGKDGPGSTWLAGDNVPATWEAKFGFKFEPTKLRMYNTHQDGRGTKTFRFLAFPLNGIMNFTYVDPSTGQNATCTSECPLSNDPKTEFQDFHFVNRVGMNSFQVAISAWYGSGAGLSGIELFEDDIFSYAVTNFNEPTCKGIEFPSKATTTGPWKQSPSVQSSSDYLTATLSGGEIKSNSASVVFTPNILESGNYSVNMYTPGCMPDGTCSTRGQVNITGVMSTGTVNNDFSTTLYQTNYFDKFDQIYFGYIEKSSDGFKPTVTLTPLAGQSVQSLTVVAQRVGFTLTKSTGGLNGLFDFDPEQKKPVDVSSLENSAINKLGSGFGQRSAVKSLVTSGDTLFIGGNFTSKEFVNAVSVSGDKQNATSLDGGLNGQVIDMHLEGTQLYAGGSFNSTLNGDKKELSNVAVYDTKANTWSALGGGVDGTVEHVVPMQINITSNQMETAISLSGTFSQCNAFKNNSASRVDGFAIWVPSLQNWMQNINQPLPTYNGILTASLQNVSDVGDLFAGSLTSAQLRANGAATLSNNGLGTFPFNIEVPPKSASSRLNRRENISNDTLRGVITGTFYSTDSTNITVLAGHFTAKSSNGSTVNNLMILDGKDNESISGLGSEISPDSTFITVALQGSVLYAGGMVSGKIGGSQIHGLVSYDISSKSFGSQPAPISGKASTVAAIAVRPDTSEVYVGGSFSKAGALGCEGLCIYNSNSGQWFQPGNGLSGEVLGLLWSSKSTLVVAGDMMANSTDKRYLATYDAKGQTWSTFPGAESIPGPVEVMTAGSSDGKQVWVAGKSAKDGSVYLMKYDGSKWLSANETLPARTILRSLQVFSLTKNHDKTDLLGESQALMMTGSIMIPGVGIASAAIFNGTHYRPYALTTNSGNAPGTIARIFTQKDDFFSTGGGSMPLGFVVLIGLAIALGLILLMVVAGIILDRLRKKREGYTPAPTSMYDRGSGIQRIPPHELLESLGRSRPGAAPHV
ncbi:cellular morphogenesis protein [Pochonia chlamydosporia 170]|uniref:Cellular morphogenesis protein n=1 Tax=Pochonia chlamydosporia 170 TaxID=1380566 RepID=A0A179G3A4_METCM|nr:cellular morphogenesis protein [Pochonia chlamydosporia 170]OAQ72237.1 cellular morphogenesis protein [Pochonia chlamydosporia 170]